jgi:hypothetical protein
MKEQIFALLSLRVLGRAMGISPDFRAAYKARLSAANPVAVSRFGEALLRALSTVILRLSRRVDLFSGRKLKYAPGVRHILDISLYNGII